MTERGFHPFAVLHFLRKTILLYLLPLLQVLFARNWAALRTALVQGAALLTVLAAYLSEGNAFWNGKKARACRRNRYIPYL